ncbi:MAG: Ig-like domain-containing protein [Myxococcota bacterium]
MLHLRRGAALVGAIVVLCSLGAAAHALQIERVSSPILYVDNTNGSTFRGMYAAYRITNNDATAYADTFVTVSGFSASAKIKPGQFEDGVQHLGPLAPGQKKTAYFYLYASGAVSVAESHTVSVFGTRPPATALATASFSLTTTDSITANANKVKTRAYLPANPVIGGTVTMTIEGDTGTVGDDGNFAFSPASGPTWPADVFELVDSRVLVANAQGVFVEVPNTKGTLFQTKAAGALVPPVSGSYRCEFLLRVVKSSPSTTPVTPVVHIRSGQQMKHNDPADAGLLPIPPATQNDVVLVRTPTEVFSPAANTVVHTITITNTGSLDVVFDDIIDDLTGSAGTATLKAGSVKYDGATVSLAPIVSGSTLDFVWFYDMLAGSSHTLSYTLVYPATTGRYPHAAYGLFAASGLGIAYVDTTQAADDFAPARALVYIGLTPLDANDDALRAAEATPVTVPASDFLANDAGADAATFTLTSASTPNGGSVSYSSVTGNVTYTSAPDVVNDSFTYRVCGQAIPSDCQIATVLVTVNQAPTQVDASVVVAVGQATATYTVASGFSDSDNHTVASVTIDGVSSGAAVASGGVITYTPVNASVPGSYSVRYTVCDSGLPSACDAAVLTVVYNDPPVLKTVAFTAAFADVVTTPFASLFTSTGTIKADNAADGDTDGIRSTQVSNASNGTFAASATLGGGSSCSAAASTTGLASVSFTAGTTVGNVTCFVRVCEELPAADLRVCSTTTITATLVECLNTGDCGSGKVCDLATHACVPCLDDQTYPTVDTGCTTPLPICDDERATPVCLECQDTAPAGGQDTGCASATPACKLDSGSNDCVECLSDPDCKGGKVCDLDTNRCVACEDTLPSGGIDHGCATVINACNESVAAGGPKCVDCLADLDCTGLNVCELATSTCFPCDDTAAGAGLDKGCLVATPICNENLPTRTCVECKDDQPAGGADDTGCTPSLPACFEAASGGPDCVQCVADADCDAGFVCNPTHQCVPCFDSAAGASLDRGCLAADPICNAALDPDRCVECLDNRLPGSTDTGCVDATPACDTSVATDPNCVECLVTADCKGGKVCDPDLKKCVACVDAVGPGLVDPGCASVINACNEANPSAPVCVDCQVDLDCSGTNVCETASATCFPCVDTAAGAATDKGCSAVEPICLTGVTPRDCVTCIDDKAAGTTADTGCTATLPACDPLAPTGPTCLECQVDIDCDDGEVCTPNHQCVPGEHPAGRRPRPLAASRATRSATPSGTPTRA